MKHADVRVGAHYRIKVSGVPSVVEVERVRKNAAETLNLYDVRNVRTGVRSTLINANIFIEEVRVIKPGDLVTVRDDAQVFKVESVSGEVIKLFNGPTVVRAFVRPAVVKANPPAVVATPAVAPKTPPKPGTVKVALSAPSPEGKTVMMPVVPVPVPVKPPTVKETVEADIKERLLKALAPGKRSTNELAADLGVDSLKIIGPLMELELAGKVKRLAANYFELRTTPKIKLTPEQAKVVVPDPEDRPRHWTDDLHADQKVEKVKCADETVEECVGRIETANKVNFDPPVITSGPTPEFMINRNYVSPGDDEPSPLVKATAKAQSYMDRLKAKLGTKALDKPVPLVSLPENKGGGVPMVHVSGLATGVSNLVVKARAGTGKTTTLVQGVKGIVGGNPRELITDNGPVIIEPMDQQALVWEEMAAGGKPRFMAFVAFNKSIATELKKRVPTECDASTMHGMGFKACLKRFNLMKGNEVHEHRVSDIIGEILGREPKDVRKDKPVVMSATQMLTSLVKSNLIDLKANAADALDTLASHYDVELRDDSRDYSGEIFDLVPKVIERCLDVQRDGCIDFDDMMWLPVALNLPLFRYDLLMVDEAQDLNKCQQAFARRAGKRLILVGDDCQAIYGFAGADSESLPRMTALLGETAEGVKELPLTVTRRCGKKIVAEANKIVPDFQAWKDNPDGIVRNARYAPPDGYSGMSAKAQETYHGNVNYGDMVLCRLNAPLVNQCFKFIKEGRKAVIQGKNVGQGLISTLTKMNAVDLPELVNKLDNWRKNELLKENARRNPSESRLAGIQDKFDCLMCFTENADGIPAVIRKIESVFTDIAGEGIRLSSIHKAKGLEAERVFFLRPKGAECPSPFAKSAWQGKQEKNLTYVAMTRAIKELIYVS